MRSVFNRCSLVFSVDVADFIIIIYLLERTKNIQTSRSTQAKYALAGVLVKDYSTNHANV